MNLNQLIITPDLLKFIAEIDEFKGTWRAWRALTPERLDSLRHVATIESIGSSTRIEGSKLSDVEVETLLQGLGAKHFASRDEEEVAGYAQAMDLVFENFDDLQLSENYLKQLHQELLRHSSKDARHRGEYKKFPNHVEAFDVNGKSLGVIFETVSPFDTPARMTDLIRWARETLDDNSLHPLIVIGVFVVEFLAIHPFQDGNGRLSRVLTSLLLLKAGYTYIPFASLEAVVEKNKSAYYQALRRTQTTLDTDKEDLLPWLRFFLQALKRQKDHLVTKVEENSADDLRNLTEASRKILDHVAKYGRISTLEALNITGIPRPTVKKRLSELVDGGFLEMRGKGRATHYTGSVK